MKKRKKCYAVIGLGRFGSAVAEELAAIGCDVIVVDRDENRIKAALSFTEYAYVMTDLSKENLSQVGVGSCDAAIVCIGVLDISLLTVLALSSLGISKILAKAISSEHGMLLERIGATPISPERDMGQRLAKQLTANSVLEYIRLSNDIDISEFSVPAALVGKTVRESGLRQTYALNLIALQTGGNTETQISPDTALRASDVLVVVGKASDILRFRRDHGI